MRAEPNVYIKERSWIERLLNRAPKAELNAGKPIMYKDKYASFSKTFLCGIDFDFMMLDVCCLSAIELVWKDDYLGYMYLPVQSRILVGVLVAYILDSFLFWMRGYMGRRNLSKHTLVDEAFLI